MESVRRPSSVSSRVFISRRRTPEISSAILAGHCRGGGWEASISPDGPRPRRRVQRDLAWVSGIPRRGTPRGHAGDDGECRGSGVASQCGGEGKTRSSETTVFRSVGIHPVPNCRRSPIPRQVAVHGRNERRGRVQGAVLRLAAFPQPVSDSCVPRRTGAESRARSTRLRFRSRPRR
jgi:hypothetical protein